MLLRNLKPLLRSKNVAASKSFVVIKEVNTQVENLKNIAKMKAFRTTVKMARTTINEKGLSKYFWAEAVHTAVHILNRCPTKALKDKTKVEAWSEIKPSVSHLKIFGCICYAHVPAEKRTKLDEKS